MRGYLVIAAAVLMQAALGGIYAWSVLADALRESFGYSSAQVQMVFGTCIGVFTLSAIWTGRIQDRLGPRLPAAASALLLAASYLTAWAGGDRFILLWLGIGVLGGLGIGCGYVCPIATAVKWFPRHKGLVCGLAVAGYGAGAIVLSQLASRLMGAGWGVRDVFALVGVVYGLAVLATGLTLVLPPGSLGPSQQPLPPRAVFLRDRRFWFLAAGIFTSTLPGLMIVSPLKAMGESFGVWAGSAVLAVSALAVGNASGRIAWGFIFDRLGRRRSTMTLQALIAASVAVLLAPALAPLGPAARAAAFIAAAAFVGFCYGGCFAVYPGSVAQLYGPEIMGTVYPMVLFAHGISAIFGPYLGGLARDLTGSFVPALAVSLAVALAGLALTRLTPEGATAQRSCARE